MPETVFNRPDALADVTTHYCPGCTHGIIHRLVAEVIREVYEGYGFMPLSTPATMSVSMRSPTMAESSEWTSR